MRLDYLNHIFGEMPVFGQYLPALTVGEPKKPVLASVDSHVSIVGGLDAPAKILGECQRVHQYSQDMQQAS